MNIDALEQEPCNTCGYEEGSTYCKEHCPHEAKIKQELTEFEEIDFMQEHKKIPVTLDLTSCGNAIDRRLVCAFIAGLISDDGEREKGLEYIRNMPSVNPQSCEDVIDRAEAIKIASGYCHPANVAKELAKLPAVNPQPKTGHWIGIDGKPSHLQDGMTTRSAWCSECGKWLTASDEYSCFGNYCPNCGARMVEPQESEE